MGAVYAEIELINSDDIGFVRRHIIGEEEIKRQQDSHLQRFCAAGRQRASLGGYLPGRNGCADTAFPAGVDCKSGASGWCGIENVAGLIISR